MRRRTLLVSLLGIPVAAHNAIADEITNAFGGFVIGGPSVAFQQPGRPKTPPECPRGKPSECRFSPGMQSVTLLNTSPAVYNR